MAAISRVMCMFRSACTWAAANAVLAQRTSACTLCCEYLVTYYPEGSPLQVYYGLRGGGRVLAASPVNHCLVSGCALL
jgi:hypothetical protein